MKNKLSSYERPFKMKKDGVFLFNSFIAKLWMSYCGEGENGVSKFVAALAEIAEVT